MRKLPFFFILCLSLCWSCGETNRDPWGILGPRILAVKAEPPEQTAGANQKITLTTLVVNTGGVITSGLTWSQCSSIGREGCEGPVLLGTSNPLTVDPPVAQSMEEALSFSENGVVYQFQVDHSDGSEKAIKRVSINIEDGNNNSNPLITGIFQNSTLLFKNAQWVVEKGKEYSIRLTVSAPEEYIKSNADGSKNKATEELYISMAADLGIIDKFRLFYPKLNNKWTAPENPSTGRIYFILRDGRGGVDWVIIPVSVK